ncbi:MAG: division/cell wall cluster transcriptional repressor MraZ [Terracidiphilus sp.]|jgi:MraZ protein
MFRGNHPAKVEESGRLKLPVPFKQLLDAATISDLYVTTEDGERAQIWPLDEWKKIEARLKKHSVGNRAVKNYLDMTGYYGQEVKMDAQGRFVLSQNLRSKARLEGDLAVIGRITHLEVVNKALFEEALPAKVPTEDDLKAVDAILSAESDV